MKILIIDVDSTIPNLALKKVERYYLDKGAEVVWNMPLMKDSVDEVFVGCIFTKNKHECEQYSHLPNAHIGGTGWEFDVKEDKTLVRVRDISLPKEIEETKPHINLGFTQRGCCWKCKWCVTPQKEGRPVAIGDLYDLWDGKSDEITLLDQNILSLPEHFKLICEQANKENIKLHFNGGLDHRLLNEDIIQDLKKVKHVKYKFAFDDISYLKTVSKAISMLQANGIACSTWYVLVGFNSTFEQDLWRLNYLKSRGQTAYVMRYEGCGDVYSALAGWANARPYFMAMTFSQFLNLPNHDRWKKLIKAAGIQMPKENSDVDSISKESKDQQCLF